MGLPIISIKQDEIGQLVNSDYLIKVNKTNSVTFLLENGLAQNLYCR